MQSIYVFADFTFQVIGPVILLLGFGYFLFQKRYVTDDFVQQASRLIFNFALPALLYVNISQADLHVLLNLKSISVAISATLVVFILSIVFVSYKVIDRNDKGVIVQAIFRANMGIIGLAYCANAYGQAGLAFAAIYMGFLTILYNVLSVSVLNIFQNQQTDIIKILKGIITNPIIIAIVLGMISAGFNIKPISIVSTSLAYIAQLTLPLALICTGASLTFTTLGKYWKLVTIATVGKCVIYPSLLIAMALFFHIDGMVLGVMYLMAMSPTAAASYVMVRKIGGNHLLAAQIVATSTIISLPITLIGYAILTQFVDLAFII